jgi:hypothetical protein
MTDLENKLYGLIKGHPEFNEEIAQFEISLMSKLDVLKHALVLHQQLEKKKPGKINVLNSWVLYWLGTTTRRPAQKFDLQKRRTYGRKGFPDIDMDFDYLRRHEIVQYIIEKYGREHVGNIGTIQKLQTKAAIRRAIKVLDPANVRNFDADGREIKTDKNDNFILENAILHSFGERNYRSAKIMTEDGEVVKSVREAYEKFPDFRRYMDAYPQVARYAARLEGSICAYGCLAKDTLVETDRGEIRIDQTSPSFCSVAYLDAEGQKKYTENYIAHMTGVKKCYKLRLVNGDWIKVTDEHLIFTDKGCVLFEEIRKNPKNYKVMSVKQSNTIPAACHSTQEVSTNAHMQNLRQGVREED